MHITGAEEEGIAFIHVVADAAIHKYSKREILALSGVYTHRLFGIYVSYAGAKFGIRNELPVWLDEVAPDPHGIGEVSCLWTARNHGVNRAEGTFPGAA